MLKNREFIEWLRNNAYLCSRYKQWRDLSSLQPQKKMLKNTLTFLFTSIYSDNFPRWLTN